jgi:hypothetical protein
MKEFLTNLFGPISFVTPCHPYELMRLTQAGCPVAGLNLYKTRYFNGTLIRPIPASWMEMAS